MKKIILLFALIIGVSTTQAQIKIGGKKIDVNKAEKAVKDVASAVTLSDADIITLCRESVEWMDANNPVLDESTEYGERLARLTENLKEVNGLPLNFKVYHVIDINAFACGDGSIRVFSALMDLMDDDELMAIIGHEIGHVAHTDVKDAMKNAYLTSAAINAAGAASETVSALSETQLGDLTKSFMGAQFSQKQEFAADDYGFKTCVENGFSPYGMANSLQKLVDLSQGAEASKIQKMFSSHPDSEKRSKRMKEKADNYKK
ncbi:MAG: M48 family metallopeptidase [Tannerella sp.]|jgi:putative metalloprotease|nr:M48 family metallopeptidase [Tannerella sp.]